MTFWGIRERERDWERDLEARGERAGGDGGARGKVYSKPTRVDATSDDDDDDDKYCSFQEANGAQLHVP